MIDDGTTYMGPPLLQVPTDVTELPDRLDAHRPPGTQALLASTQIVKDEERQTLNPKPSTLNLRPSALNTRSSTLNLKP